MGLDVSIVGYEEDINSDKYPEHLFKKTYLRSSYNSGGFNNISCNLIGKDLYWIFEPIDNGDDFIPDWKNCLERAIILNKELSKAINEKPYRVEFESSEDLRPQDGIIDSQESALKHFLEKELAKHNDKSFDSYGNAKGIFYLKEPMQVSGLIRGKMFGFNGFYIITKDLKMNWYSQASEIVIEFCEFGKENNSKVSWSG